MSAVGVLAIAACGGIGAGARFVVDALIRRRVGGTFPLATMVVNISGCFLLGLVTGLVTARLLPTGWQAVVGAGFLGGYTTFSTASFETVRLAEERRGWATLASGFGMLVAGVGLAGLGFVIGRTA